MEEDAIIPIGMFLMLFGMLSVFPLQVQVQVPSRRRRLRRKYYRSLGWLRRCWLLSACG